MSQRFREWCLPWNWPWEIWAAVVVACLMLLPFAIRAVILSGVPVIDDPFDVQEFVKWDVPPGDDAFTDYRQAVVLRDGVVAELQSRSQSEPDKFDALDKQGWDAADDLLKQWLESHHEAMTVWKRGTTKEHGLNLPPDQLTFDSILHDINELRMFARLALVEEARCIYAGQMEDAWSWARAANRSGGHCSYRGCMIQGLVGASIHKISTDGIARWAEQPAVTSEQLRLALAETRSDYALYELSSNLLKVEYLAARKTLRSQNWLLLTNYVQQNPEDFGSRTLAAANRMRFWVMGEPELTIRVFRQVLANQIPEVDKPIASQRKRVSSGVALLFDSDPAVPLAPGQLDPARIDRVLNRSSLTLLFLPAVKQFCSIMLQQSAREVTIETVLAVQAYRRDHGDFPEALSQLVPDYLDAVPLDLCDPDGGNLRYRRDDGTKGVVWSVGVDGIDGGGDVDGTGPVAKDAGYRIRFGQRHRAVGDPGDQPPPTGDGEQPK